MRITNLMKHTAALTESDSAIEYCVAMTTRVRRQRGTPTKGTYFRLAPDVNQLILDYSEQFGVPTWAIVEAALRAAKPGEDGVPVGWVLPVAVNPIAMLDVDIEEVTSHRRTA